MRWLKPGPEVRSKKSSVPFECYIKDHLSPQADGTRDNEKDSQQPIDNVESRSGCADFPLDRDEGCNFQ